MEWGFKENSLAVIALHKRGKLDSQIFQLLKPLKISQNFLYRAIKRYKESVLLQRQILQVQRAW
jgi:uncharacterized membrane protein YobD (UPF0266 family)